MELLNRIPPYLGAPSTVEGGLIFDKLSIVEHYGIKPAKVDHYEMYEVLDDGQKVEVEVKDLTYLSFKEDLVQKAIRSALDNAQKSHYLGWWSSMVLDTKPRPPTSVPVLFHWNKGSSTHRSRRWCTRWPTEGEVISMLIELTGFELGVAL